MIEVTPSHLVKGDVIQRSGENITVDHMFFSKAEDLWLIYSKEHPSVPFRYEASQLLKVKRT